MLQDFIKITGPIYMFPKGFIRAKEVLKNETGFSGWCERLLSLNDDRMMGVSWSGGDSYTYWTPWDAGKSNREKIYVNNNGFTLGGLL